MKDVPFQPPGSGAWPHDDEEIAALLRSVESSDRVPDDELPPIKTSAREAWLRQVRRTAARRRAAYAALAIAAAILLVIGIAVLRPTSSAPLPAMAAATLETWVGEAIIGDRPAPEAPTRELRPGTTIATGDQGRAALRLATGPSVRVDVESSVRIVSGRALRLERGAIYVDSEGSPAAATRLEIETPFGRVTDMGTQFEVRLLPADAGDGGPTSSSALRVRVREGAVRLATSAGAYEAGAGSELRLRAGGQLDHVAAAPYGNHWQWIESVHPPLAIEGVELEVFLDWAARESGRSWRFSDPQRHTDTRGVILHGSVEGMTVDEALSTVLPSCGLRHRVAGDELLIERE